MNPIVEISDSPYDTHVGYINTPWQENQTCNLLTIISLDYRPRGYGIFGYNDGTGKYPEIVPSHDMRISHPLHPSYEPNEERIDVVDGKEHKEKLKTTGFHHTPRDLTDE